MAGLETQTKASTAYGEARNLRLQENQKRFQDLGISELSKSLSSFNSPEKKSKQHILKPKPANAKFVEPRRSSRARNPVSYRDELDIDLPVMRKRSRSTSSSWESYVSRPIEEIRLASYEERALAVRAAEEFQNSMQSGNPSFVKSMVRSHVYSCFWLGLPTQFCKDYLPKTDLDMILEDENGSLYDAKFLGKRTGLSGGWRGFALDHKLDDGDAVVFELVEPDKFKLYTFRVNSLSSQGCDVDVRDKVTAGAKNGRKDGKKKLDSPKKLKPKKTTADKNDDKLTNNGKPQEDTLKASPTENEILDEEDEAHDEIKSKEEESKNGMKHVVVKARKKPASKLFRKKT